MIFMNFLAGAFAWHGTCIHLYYDGRGEITFDQNWKPGRCLLRYQSLCFDSHVILNNLFHFISEYVSAHGISSERKWL